MAKYDWKQLEKEYLLSDYKSVSSFLKNNNIPNNGNTKKAVKGWKNKKVLKEERKSTKVIEKVIEKQAEKEADEIVTVNNVAMNLLLKIEKFDDISEKNIKSLTSALKDLDDILKDKTKSNDIEDLTVLADMLGFGDDKRKQ